MKTFVTPLIRMDHLSSLLGVDLWIKRDDLFPMTGGGNKARKISFLLDEALASHSNALVTTGGLQSNHARVAAMAAAQLGWPCRLILHGSEDESATPKGNLLIAKLCGATIDIVSPEKIREAIDESVGQLCEKGLRPYVIPGGGHTVGGAMAYFEAALEVDHQCQEAGWFPDVLLLASGTGTTQAGLVAGMVSLGRDTRVVGISIARRNPRGTEAVADSLSEVRAKIGDTWKKSGKIEFRDEWTCGGYEKADERIWDVIKLAGNADGLMLDPTYTGKAFRALVDLVSVNEIPAGSRVLFWHTGGLMNLMASNPFTNRGSQIERSLNMCG